MYKNVKSRIILISVIVGLLLIGSLGFLYLTSINKIQNILNEENNIQAIIQKTQNIYSNSEISIAIIIFTFIVISVLISLYLYRF